jgi:hypothetical protein
MESEEKLWYEEKVSEGLSFAGDRNKLNELIDFFYSKDQGRFKFKELRKGFNAFKRMIGAWFEGKYQDISYAVFVNTFAGILYIGSRLKNYKERMKSLKFIADIGIIVWIMQTIDKEVEKFKDWEAREEAKTVQTA